MAPDTVPIAQSMHAGSKPLNFDFTPIDTRRISLTETKKTQPCPNIKSGKKGLRLYRHWIEKALKKRGKNRVVLVVDKSSHKMALFIGGHRQHTYDVELGMEDPKTGPVRPTLLGTFDLKYKQHTRYHKSLLYKWILPKGDRKHVASYEIHGAGSGRGADGEDWTFGCIALSNRQIDDLYERIGLDENGVLVNAKNDLQH